MVRRECFSQLYIQIKYFFVVDSSKFSAHNKSVSSINLLLFQLSDKLLGWNNFWNPIDRSGVLPYQQVNIIKQYSSTLLGQVSDLPVAEEKRMSLADLARAIENPNQAVLFTFNSNPGHITSGHVVVLAAYDPNKGFGFLNSGALNQGPHSLTYFSVAEMERYIDDPIGLSDNNFVVISRP